MDVGVGEFLFLFVGRLIQQRGIPYLLHAFEKVVRHEPNARIIMVGSGPEDRLVRDFAARLPNRAIRMLQPMSFEDLPSIYAIADAYVQPSVAEPYSLSTAQAAISGLPIVSTDCVGATYDFCGAEAAPLIVPARDAEALARAMMWAVSNQSTARGIGKASQVRALRRTLDWAAHQFTQAVARSMRPQKKTSSGNTAASSVGQVD
jgi:glycosyltransferase involved in cell wall biosynthesis